MTISSAVSQPNSEKAIKMEAEKNIKWPKGRAGHQLPPPQTIMACSLGKDSIAALILALRDGVHFDHVYFMDMRGAEFEETYAFIPKVENALGVKIERIESPYTFDELFYRKITKGPRTGKNRGWAALITGCYFQRDMKSRGMRKLYKGGNADIYMGVAADEAERANRKEFTQDTKNRYHFPLIEHGYTESMARELCAEYNLLHPLYKIYHRLGCWQCNRQSIEALRKLYWYYPEKMGAARRISTRMRMGLSATEKRFLLF